MPPRCEHDGCPVDATYRLVSGRLLCEDHFRSEAGSARRAADAETTAHGAVLRERQRQNAVWGEQNHDAGTWLAILLEEVGELSEAVLHRRFGGPKAGGIREECVQVAAVALQMVECIDRNGGGGFPDGGKG